MTVVKGSKQERLVVVSHDPVARFWKRVIVLAIMVGLGVAGYWHGISKSQQAQSAANAELVELRQQLKTAKSTVSSNNQRVAMLEKGGEVDRKATEGMRQTIVDLRGQIAVLQEEVAFYKGLMAPASRKQGLRIQKVDIQTALEDKRYRYKVMLTQVGSNQTYISGLAAVNVVGVTAGKQVTYPIRDLDSEVQDYGIKFRFRYFQEIAGEMVLPEGFVPENIEVVLQSKGAKAARVETTFPWPSQEEMNVGQ